MSHYLTVLSEKPEGSAFLVKLIDKDVLLAMATLSTQYKSKVDNQLS